MRALVCLRILAGLVLLAACAARAEAPRPAFTVLFSAEAHAALLPCDCPLEPLGGVARRAARIAEYRKRGPVLLLDAGGWASGGIYDEESDGDPARDALRSELMAQAMGLMRYDAVGWSDEEWASEIHGPDGTVRPGFEMLLPLRVFTHWPGQPLPQQGLKLTWKPLDIGEVRAALLAVPDFEGADFKSMQALMPPEAGARPVEFAVALAPLGEDEAARLARESPVPLDLVIGGGRKSTTRSTWREGRTIVANFDYQVQRLGVAEVFSRAGWKAGDEGSRWDVRVRFEPLDEGIPDDPEVAALLQPHLETLRKRGKRKLTVEYWTMAECPFCAEVQDDLAQAAQELAGRVTIEPHFMVSKAPDGSFQALHGPRELDENRVQALIWKYYPERFWDWQRWRKAHAEAPWTDGARELGLLKARIAGALALGEADELLERDYKLSLRRHVEGTPSLIVAQRPYDGELQRLPLLRVLCGMLDDPKPAICAQVPACFFDAQCRKRGFVGRCLDAGTAQARCDFSQPALEVEARIVVEAQALWGNHERILEILLGYLPGLKWRLIEPDSEEGRAVVAKYGLTKLPAYVLGAQAAGEVDFEKNLGSATVRIADGLIVKSELSGAHRRLERPRQAGRADLFVSRFSASGQEALEAALALLAELPEPPELYLHDALYWQDAATPGTAAPRKLAARGGRAELEDAALAQAVLQLEPEKHPAYLLARGKHRGSLYWDRALREAGLDPEAVRKRAEGPSEEVLKALQAEADLLAALETGGEIVLLGENCELLPVRSRSDLRDWLERIGKRRPRKP
ncbi:MAG: hypothetical protein HS116_17320 [Planctomycetes bacterium]|nr:hypothetical protein [Planctomycetota bacterium]